MAENVWAKMNWGGTAAAIAAVSCWSIGPVCIRYLTGPLDVWSQNSLRYGAAVVFWLPFLALSLHGGHVDRRVWKRALLPAAVNVLMQSCWAGSLYYLEPGLMSLVNKLSILWVVTLSMVLFAEERPMLRSKRLLFGMAMCVVGVVGVIVSKSGSSIGSPLLWGVSLGVMASLAWAVYTVSARIAYRDIDARTAFAVTSLYTTFGLVGLAIALGKPAACLAMNVKEWSALIGSGVLCIAVAHVLFYVAIKKIGATIPSMIVLTSPFGVLAMSWVWFGETLTRWQWFFGLVLVAGAALATLAQTHLHRKE